MADGTKIEWTDATVNAVNGCSVVSPGCTNCYAMRLAGTRMKHHPSRAGLTTDSKAGPVWNGTVRLNETALLQPLRWTKPRRIFWNAHGDLFHPAVPDAWIDKCFAVMALTPQHVHQVLTKRSARMRAYFADKATAGRIARAILDGAIVDPKLLRVEPWPVRSIGDLDDPVDVEIALPLPNVWLGVSVEDQARRDRILDLAETPAAVRFLSGEPLLEYLGLTNIPIATDDWNREWMFDALSGEQFFVDDLGFRVSGDGPDMQPLDWVIVGGESGPGSRPMHPNWARSLRNQCADAGVPFFFKQWGDWFPYGEIDADGHYNCRTMGEGPETWHIWRDAGEHSARIGKRTAGRLLDGVQHDGMPS